MKLSHILIDSPLFVFESVDELVVALGKQLSAEEEQEIVQLAALKLPPMTSMNAVATMLGVNSGVIWSMIYNSGNYYRKFYVRKGNGLREIIAPRISLKIIQTWLAANWARSVKLPDHVYGFVPGRSHIQAAFRHRHAEWVLSVDIRNFFPSTSQSVVKRALIELGYGESSALLISALTCLDGMLIQGAPTSPTLSNICFIETDLKLVDIGRKFNATLTRYADDIVFSGKGKLPSVLINELDILFANSPWRLAEEKTYVGPLKGRLKVHGLLVGNGSIRLTKGYRNKIKSYEHMLHKNISEHDRRRLLGHINYARQVESLMGGMQNEKTHAQ